MNFILATFVKMIETNGDLFVSSFSFYYLTSTCDINARIVRLHT